MKLLEKYSNEITVKDQVILKDLLNKLKDADKGTLSLLLSKIGQASKVHISSYNIEKEIEMLQESDEDKAVQLLHSYCQDTMTGCAIVTTIAIMYKLDKETFEYVNEKFNFKDFEKKTKLSVVKYFKNKASTKYKELDKVREIMKEYKQVLNVNDVPLQYTGSLAQMTAYAIAGDYNKKEYSAEAFSILMSRMLSETKFTSIRRFLNMIIVEENKKSMNTYSEAIKYIKVDSVYQKTNSSRELILVTKVGDMNESLAYSVFSGEAWGGLFILMRDSRGNKNKPFYIEPYSYNECIETTLKKEDYESVMRGKSYINVYYDRSFSALEKNRRYSNTKLVSKSPEQLSQIKKWLRTQNFDNLLGGLIDVECSDFSYTEDCYAIITKIYWNKEKNKMMMSCLVADIVNDHFNIEERELPNLDTIKLYSKDEAAIFYQEVLHIKQSNLIMSRN